MDATENLCPICWRLIKDGEPWTLVEAGAVHESCEPDARPAPSTPESRAHQQGDKS